MTTTAANGIITIERNWKTWLFNPFLFVAGFKALIIGLVFIMAASLLGYAGNVHFDGVLDVHMGRTAPVWAFIAEGLIDWLSISLMLAIFAFVMWRKTSRLIDVVGTQALARWPVVISAILLQIPAYQRALSELVTKAQQHQSDLPLNPADVTVLIVISIILITMIVWMVALMYRAFAVSCNAKGTKAVVAFIVAIVIGELISKLLIANIPVFMIVLRK